MAWERRYNMKKGELDLISKLPEHIIHHIQSFLPTKDAARTCILSKAWNSVCSSYPIIYFDYNLFALQLSLSTQDQSDDQIKERFIDFVDSQLLLRLVHHQEQNQIHIRHLALNVVMDDSKYLSRLGHWMELVKQAHHVDELCLFVHNINKKSHHNNFYYDFPCDLFATKGLQVVSIDGCKFNGQKSFAGISSSSLKKLYLSYAYIEDENVLVNLMHCCHEIEELEIVNCTLLSSKMWPEIEELEMWTLKLPNFPKLKKVSYIDNKSPTYTVFEIEATSLESFICRGNNHCTIMMNPAACSNIRELSLNDCFVYNTRNLFQNLATTFPLLEKAYILDVPDASATDDYNEFVDSFPSVIAAPHHRLRILHLRTTSIVEEVTLDCPSLRQFSFMGGEKGVQKLSMNCPNLNQFEYIGAAIPITTSPLVMNPSAVSDRIVDSYVLTCPKHAGVDTDHIGDSYILTSPKHDVDTLWFVELRRFIKHLGSNIIPMKIAFSLENTYMATFNIEGLEDAVQFSSEYNGNFCIRIHDNMRGQAALVDGLLWSIHPTTLTIEQIKYSYDFIKLCRRSGDSSNCDNCEEICNKHWWHHIKDFKVESNVGAEDIKGNPYTFLERCQTTSGYKTLMFRFSWF